MLPVKFDFASREDRRGITFEGIEADHPDPEGALHLEVRLARDHLVLERLADQGRDDPGCRPANANPRAAPVRPGGLRLRRLPGR